MLEHIQSPYDIKNLTVDELLILCTEIRQYIQDVVFETGGHLSSNLGVVELTVALHYVYDLFYDTLIFDVSHQAYTHKILTGRKHSFPTLRQHLGLSGYTNPAESPYDHFMFAHAGTSISTALGVANAQRLNGKEHKTLALIGDASIACGMALEALNHAGQIQENLLVILNDNGMSIAPSVGSFSTYLHNIRMTPLYQDMKKDFTQFLTKIPLVGKKVTHGLGYLLNIIKYQCAENQIGHIFEELKFQYYGPIDGHNLPLLIDLLGKLKYMQGSILLHVITEKGQGNSDAMHNPEKYHGVSPSKAAPTKTSSISFTEAFSQSLIELARTHKNIIGITAAMPGGTGLNHFQKHFPDRYFDVGICEQHAIGFAAGQSVGGLRPVCAIYSTFLQRCYDQIFQELCLNNRPVLLVLDRAGIAGQDGATHAGVFDIAYLRCLPNMILMAPRNSLELRDMLTLAMNFTSPCAIRIPRDNCYEPFKDLFYTPIQYGRGQILCDPLESELILVGYGVMANVCLEVAERLLNEGIHASVVNARFAKPLDVSLFQYLFKQNKPIITVEEHSVMGGFGSAVLELAAQQQHTHAIYLRGVPDRFTNQGTRKEILAEIQLDVDGILGFILNTVLNPVLMS